MLFDTTVRRELAKSFGATLVVILTIVLTMFLIRTVGQAAGGRVAPQDVALLLGYVALGNLPTMLMLSLFVAIVLSLGRMYRDSEMAIWFASGVSIGRFVRPVLQMAWPVLLVVGLLLLFAWPWGNRNSTELRDRYLQRSDLSRVAPGVFQTSRDGQRVFYIDRDSPDAVDARNVFILTHTARGESVTSAKTGRLVTEGADRYLVLQRGQRNDVATTGERTLSSFETYRVLTSENAVQAAQAKPPKTLDTLDLLRQSSLQNQAELVWRIGLLLATGNLLLLGIGLSASNPRRASNWNLLFALLAFFAYSNLVNTSQALVSNGRLSMGASLLGLHGGVLLLGLALLWWRDHGAVLALRRPAAAGRTGTAA